VTGICRVPVVRALVGVKVMVIVHEAVGARVVQLVVGVKFAVAVVGVAIWRVAELVLVKVMVCCVAVGPGTLLKVRAVGLRARPGSGLPKPMSWAVTEAEVVGIVRVPVRGPVAVGVKIRLTKQEALGARAPLQTGPPVGNVVGSATLKLPVVVGVLMEMVEVVRLARVKRVGALVLCTGMGPKSCVMGVRVRPVRGRPVPVRVKGEGVPEAMEVRVRVAVCGPGVDGVNSTPSQQLVQGPVKVVVKAEVGGAPWP